MEFWSHALPGCHLVEGCVLATTPWPQWGRPSRSLPVSAGLILLLGAWGAPSGKCRWSQEYFHLSTMKAHKTALCQTLTRRDVRQIPSAGMERKYFPGSNVGMEWHQDEGKYISTEWQNMLSRCVSVCRCVYVFVRLCVYSFKYSYLILDFQIDLYINGY